tara:strand:- start:35 stop:409 length:375 start_codon:yes stop_codon:yes gene_type:complete
MAAASNRNTTLTPSYFEETDLTKEGGSDILKSGTGNLYTISLTKGGTTGPACIKFYDATDFTYGTDHPDIVITMAATQTSMVIVSRTGVAFTSGVCVGAGRIGGTASGSDNDPADATQIEIVGD